MDTSPYTCARRIQSLVRGFNSRKIKMSGLALAHEAIELICMLLKKMRNVKISTSMYVSWLICGFFDLG